ncbi:peptidylprolyl isomerase [Algibacter luteus]|uniref:PPIC-type PPIASE domain-containing protein n=1 Tax=Algibacter luteus TaxID=1178825 RepID=A0A1M6EM95_9FLAO|nr:peptidylprolyl isomerase [Algibacter luteus]SHI86574.1 PPIC-type PPIASE domain-containing protein [Algibacter luteus]
MLQKLLSLFFICFSIILTAQTSVEEELKVLESPEQVKSYLETKASKKNKIIVFNEEKHKTILAKELFKQNIGGTKINENEFEKTYFKVINKTEKTYHRVAYIYLDGAEYSLDELNDLRDKIIAQYHNGAPFDFLAKQYSMDGNAKKGGDLGWFLEGEMHPDFEVAIFNTDYNVNDIFTVDIPSENWYYVVLKTHDPKDISEIEVLKIVESKI